MISKSPGYMGNGLGWQRLPMPNELWAKRVTLWCLDTTRRCRDRPRRRRRDEPAFSFFFSFFLNHLYLVENQHRALAAQHYAELDLWRSRGSHITFMFSFLLFFSFFFSSFCVWCPFYFYYFIFIFLLLQLCNVLCAYAAK